MLNGARPGVTAPVSATASSPEARPYRVRWGTIFAVWSLPALVASYATYVAAETQGHAIPFWRALAMQCPGWFVWVPLTPAVFALARRFPIERRPGLRAISAHFALMMLSAILYTTVFVWSSMVFRPSPLTLSRATVESVFVGSMVMTLVLYAATLAMSLVLDYARRDRERDRRTLELEAQLARAELHTLRAQLHPHVLFNALHTIALLARRDSNEAIRVTVLLGNVLRSVLDSGATDERPLRDEVSLIEQYLAIELVRFADRLEVVWDIEPDTLDAMVPTLLLQPLVENALRHGIARSVNGGTVVVSAARAGASIRLTVWNDGPSLPGGRVTRRGVGLRNTEERLNRLYAEAGRLEIANDPDGGVRVCVELPWRTSDNTADNTPATSDGAGDSVLAVAARARYAVTGEPVPDVVVASSSDR